MAKLSTAHKRLIVMRLAAYTPPSEVVAELREAGVEVKAHQVVYYDPATAHTELAQEWRDLFARTREAVLKDVASIAIAQKTIRLRELNQLYLRAKAGKNIVLALDVLERAAKEMGEAYSNKRIIEAKDPASALAAMLGVSVDDVNAAVATMGELH